MKTHTKSYIICTTPRSGSTLLCDLLTATNLAGQPNSYFMREHFTSWARKFDVSISKWKNEQEFDQSYLSAVMKEGVNGTRVFGLRLMWKCVSDLTDRLKDILPSSKSDHDLFQLAFGRPLHFLHLSREDKVEQAVSLLKAEQSGLWHVNTDGTERERLKPKHHTTYDSVRLLEILKTLEEDDLAWKNWFFKQGIQPEYITYESLASKPQAIVGNVLSSLALDPSIAKNIEPVTTKLANNESSEWIARFRREIR